jgi:multimeric flavodoxin WrbA
MVLGIQGSPRRGGNSDALLAACLQGAKEAGARIETVRPAALKISGCLACGACEKTGECAVEDDMQKVYPLLDEAERIVVASPIFFYSFPAQLKALVDRAQSRWARRLLLEKFPPRREKRLGYLIAVGATRGKNLFEGAELAARYFYEALGMEYCGGMTARRLDEKDAVSKRPELLDQARELGRRLAKESDCIQP